MEMKTAGDILDANVMGWGGGRRKRPCARARRLSNGKTEENNVHVQTTSKRQHCFSLSFSIPLRT